MVCLCILVVSPVARKCAFTAIKRSLPGIKNCGSHVLPPPLMIIMAIITNSMQLLECFAAYSPPTMMEQHSRSLSGRWCLGRLGSSFCVIRQKCHYLAKEHQVKLILGECPTLSSVVLIVSSTRECRAWFPLCSFAATALLQKPREVWIGVFLLVKQ